MPEDCKDCGGNLEKYPPLQVSPSEPDAPEPMGFFGMLADAGHSFVDVVKFVTGPATTELTFNYRHDRCEMCSAVDSKNERLYREVKPGWYSCGAPRLASILRDSSVEGCGCVLNKKWASTDQHCPLKEPRW